VPTSFSRLLLGCLSLSLLASCAPDGAADLPADGEAVSVALTAVPTGMRCVRFTSVAGARVYAQDFDVTGLANLTAQVRGLPANIALSITADAYAVACPSITPTTQAAWVSAPVAVTLTPGIVPPLSFALRPAGGVSGGVDFLFLAASPQSKAFPAMVVGQTSTTSFTIINIGPTATGPLSAAFPSGTTQFSLGTSTCEGVALAVNGSCTIQVTFAPTAAGAKSGTFQVTGAPGGALPVSVSGTGVQAAALAFAPATAQDFGMVGVGKSSPQVTYTVTNSGGLTTAAVAVTSSDPAFVVSGSTCDVLDKGQSCTVKVAFSPTAIAMKSATLTATAGAVTATASVTGNGVAAPALTLTPSTLDFGTVVVGETKSLTVAVKNVGAFALDSFSAFVGGTGGDNAFVIDTRPCSNSGPLAAGATCNMTVTAAPTINLGGPTIASSTSLLISTAGTYPATVMGTASATVSWPMMGNPLTVFFGSVSIGTSATATIRLTNVGTKPVGPVKATISSGWSAFTMASDGCTTTGQYAPGAFCDVTVRFTPTTSPQVSGFVAIQLPSTNFLFGPGFYGSGK
jgi:hypothetical protein